MTMMIVMKDLWQCVGIPLDGLSPPLHWVRLHLTHNPGRGGDDDDNVDDGGDDDDGNDDDDGDDGGDDDNHQFCLFSPTTLLSKFSSGSVELELDNRILMIMMIWWFDDLMMIIMIWWWFYLDYDDDNGGDYYVDYDEPLLSVDKQTMIN